MKKLIAMILAAAMLLSLAACTSTAAADDTESVPASSDTSTETLPEMPDGFGGSGESAPATQADVQRATDFAALERQNNEGVAATRQSAYDVTSAVKDNAYNILGELRDLQSVTESGISVQQKCCCDILRAIDGVNYNASINACEIKTAIHAEGEATRTLLQQQENQRLRDELAQSRAANNDYMQSQYILGQLGRYYQNPPCNPCGCGA